LAPQRPDQDFTSIQNGGTSFMPPIFGAFIELLALREPEAELQHDLRCSINGM